MVLPIAGCGAGSKRTKSATAPVATVTQPIHTAPPATTISPSNGAATAILPARFVVNADGSLSPPLVAGPVDTTILMTLSSRAAHPVQVTVASHSLTVPPGGHASARLAGLKAGRYAIQVNGTPRAAVVVGAQPGP